MARVKQVVTDFTTGEISPRMIARTDLESYKHGAKEMVNAYPLPHGACTRRRGTKYLGELKDITKAGKLIPFIYSRTLSYILVLNGGYIRFIRDGEYIMNGASPYEIAMPYLEEELPLVRYTQVGNTIYFVHANHFPMKLQRSNDTNWTLTAETFTHKAVTDFWYENTFVKFKIIAGTTAFKTGDNFTIAAPAGTLTDPAPTNTGNGTIAAITIKPNAPIETWTITCDYADANRQEWLVSGSVSGVMTLTWNTDDYPRSIVFHEQRLYFGGQPSKPQSIWASSTGNYTTFTQGAKDDDAFSFTIASNQYDELIHLVSSRYLIPLTYGGEFSMTGSSTTGITPSAVRITPQTYHGSNDTKPVKIGNEILFVQRDSKKVRAISYSVAEDVNVAPDISVLAEHITETGIKDVAFAQDPDYISWWIRNDGTLLSCVHVRDFNMTGWSQHTTNGLFENVAVVPEENQDTVYFIVNRTIDGNTKRYIEYITYDDNVYLDCALIKTNGTATDTWTGFDHLEGQTISVIGDGYILPNVVVSGGSITLTKEVSNIIAGLPYSTYVVLQHPNIQNEHGTSQGGRLHVSRVIAKVQDTVGLRINDIEIPFFNFGDNMDTAIEPYTGEKEVKNLGWSRTEYMRFEQPYPLPWTLLSVVMFVNSND